MTSRVSISQSTASYVPAISESKRADVLQAAGKCFLKNGFARTTMDQIARDADVSKLTLYSHFQNKETLFKAMIEAKCREYVPSRSMVSLADRDPRAGGSLVFHAAWNDAIPHDHESGADAVRR